MFAHGVLTVSVNVFFFLNSLCATFEFRYRKPLVEHQIGGRRPDKITQGISSTQHDFF